MNAIRAETTTFLRRFGFKHRFGQFGASVSILCKNSEFPVFRGSHCRRERCVQNNQVAVEREPLPAPTYPVD